MSASLQYILARMRFPFALKLSVALSVLTLTVTGLSLTIMYFQTRALVLSQLQERLREISRAGVLHFDAQQRGTIKSLIQAVQDESLIRDPEKQKEIGELDEDGSVELLSPERSAAIMSSPGFQAVVQSLRKVRESTREQIQPPGRYDPLHIIQAFSGNQPLIEYVFLYIKIPDYPDGKYLVYIGDSDYAPVDANGDGDFEDEDDYAGNPVGNLFIPPTVEMVAAFSGEKALAEKEFNSDKWGTWLSGFAPIKDENGKVLAILGVDFNVHNEANELRNLRNEVTIMTGLAIVFAILLGILIARFLSRPIEVLRQGAARVAGHDFSTQIVLRSKDEMGQLAEAFNSMVIAIQKHSQDLQDVNKIRAVLESSNQLKSEIIAKVNHELQMPLLGVIANLGFIKSAIARGDLTQVEGQIRKLSNYCIYQRTLINNMIFESVSEIREPFYIDLEDTADLQDCVNQAASLVEDVHDGNVEFGGSAPPVFVPCQQEILMIILVNIFSNCAEHAQQTWVEWNETDEFVLLNTVSNPRTTSDINSVFQPWKTTRRNKTRPILGLGTNIARNLLIKIGGNIETSMREGRFYMQITIPRVTT